MRKFVKVARLGDQVKEFFVEEGQTVGSLLDEVGIDPEGWDLRVNGVPSSRETPLEDGDIVTLVPPIKGGI